MSNGDPEFLAKMKRDAEKEHPDYTYRIRKDERRHTYVLESSKRRRGD